MKIVLVSGAIANKPFNGGASWTRLNWLLGFRKLGFDAYFVEQIDPAACVDEAGQPAAFEQSANLSYFRKVTGEFDLHGKAALVCGNLSRVEGMDRNRLFEIAGSAELLVNISGHLSIEALKDRAHVKAYIDLDPGFTQSWHASGTSSKLAGHDYFFTVGENIGTPNCSIPMDGIEWRPTRQPVVLEQWPVCREGDACRFTTVASWRGPFGPVEYDGRTLGSKVRQFRKYASLPSLLNEEFELALDIHPLDGRDRDLLCRNSWKLVDPRAVVPDPLAFRRYVQGSGAEFSVAQEIYVETGSGWFSDRSVRYLASGKPVLVEDTGFSRNYPAGDGLLAFSSPEQAIAGVRRITSNYASHTIAARQIAETYFDSGRVLGQLLDQMGMCP
jgi:hypothetical protein